jgi:hypothetical protein
MNTSHSELNGTQIYIYRVLGNFDYQKKSKVTFFQGPGLRVSMSLRFSKLAVFVFVAAVSNALTSAE